MSETWDRVAIGSSRRGFGGVRRAFLFAALALAAAGCDQKDPDPDTEPEDGGSPDPGKVDAAAYLELAVRDSPYPMVDRASWVYRHRGGDTTWDEQVTLTAERYQGQEAFLLADSEGPSGSRSESVLVQQGTAAARVHKEVLFGDRIDSTVDYDPGFLRFDLAWLGVADGFSEEREYARVELDAMGNVLRDGDRAHAFTVESLDDSVSAPIGDLDGCIRIYRERVRNTGATTSEDDNKRFWFCPGIGKVREEDDGGKVEELVECDVPGGRCP